MHKAPLSKGLFLLFFCLIFVALYSPINGFAAEGPQGTKHEKAMWLYQHERYEEALAILTKLKDEEPKSSMVAYYLGMTYKQMQDFLEAKPYLEAAVTLQPSVKNALPELIDLLYQIDRVEEAKKWIAHAEEEGVTPAQIAFFKGLVLLKEAKDPDGAIGAFDEAQKLDESLAKTVKYYKAFAYTQSKNYRAAKDIFKDIVVREPTTDLAAFANEYMDAIERTEKATKPFNGYVAYTMQYDDNVILKPNDDTLAAGVGNEGDWRQAVTAQGELSLKPVDFFSARGGYTFYGAKQLDLGFYDSLSHDFYVHPAFYLKKAAIAFPLHYNYATVNDKKYLETYGLSNMDNIMFAKDQMAQLLFQINFKDYSWPVARDNDNRDAREYLWAAGWYYFFTKKGDGYLSIRYAANYEDTKGNNWTYFGNRITASSTIPVMKTVKLSIVGDYFRQDFAKINSTYEKKRCDDVVTLSSLIAVEVMKDLEVQLQYTFVDDAANIGIFKYQRNIYSAGLKYEF